MDWHITLIFNKSWLCWITHIWSPVISAGGSHLVDICGLLPTAKFKTLMLHKQITSLVWPAVHHSPRTCMYSTGTSQLCQLPTTTSPDQHPPNTHYRITLYRSAIALPKRYKDTLVSLGIHRRMQTVYHLHSPDIAGKILRVKELVTVENVPASSVRTKSEQRWERRPQKGFEVIQTFKDRRW